MNSKVVLACVDSSSLNIAVCDYACWLALRAQAPLKLLHTIDHHPEVAKTADLSGSLNIDAREQLLEDIARQEHEEGKKQIQAGKQLLGSLRDHVIEQGIKDPDLCLQHGSVIENLLGFKEDIRTLVIGARGTKHQDQQGQIGSRLEAMIRSMHQPILVVYRDFTEPKTIMLAYNGSQTAERALNLVASNPLYNTFTCHLVMAASSPADGELLQKAGQKLRESGVREVVSALIHGRPEQALCQYQLDHNIDLTVMGAFSHTRIHHFILGSFTTKMLAGTHTPLLLQR